MPLYEFISEVSGEKKEQYFNACDAPDIGSILFIDGEPCIRVISMVDSSRKNSTTSKYPVASRALPKYCEGAEHVKSGVRKGQPIITSEMHKKELCRRHGYTRDY